MSEELSKYVYESLNQRIKRDDIRTTLERGKWTKEEIDDALASWLDPPPNSRTGVPCPVRKPKATAREAAQYTLLFIALAISVVAVGNLAFNALDALIPNPKDPYNVWSASQVNAAVASLIVGGITFLFLTVHTARAIARDPVKRSSPARKWATWAAIGFSGAFTMGDLIVVLTNLFEGDFPLNYALKLLTVLALAGSVLWYYISDLRKEEAPPQLRAVPPPPPETLPAA